MNTAFMNYNSVKNQIVIDKKKFTNTKKAAKCEANTVKDENNCPVQKLYVRLNNTKMTSDTYGFYFVF